jgi:hypothetical protein
VLNSIRVCTSQLSVVGVRVFSVALCAMLYALCVSVSAQQPAKIPRIGYLTNESVSATAARGETFLQGLRELGYVEG